MGTHEPSPIPCALGTLGCPGNTRPQGLWCWANSSFLDSGSPQVRVHPCGWRWDRAVG